MTCVGDDKTDMAEASDEAGQFFSADKRTCEARVDLSQPRCPFGGGGGDEEASCVDEPTEEYNNFGEDSFCFQLADGSRVGSGYRFC